MVKASTLLLALVATVLSVVPGAFAECPPAPWVTITSIDRPHLYTTLEESYRVTIKGCNFDQPHYSILLGGISCRKVAAPTPTDNGANDDGLSTVACDLPPGPLFPDESGLIIKNAHGTTLFSAGDAVTFVTPQFQHILPRVAPDVGITARMGVSGLIQEGDPIARYEVKLIGLPAKVQDIGHHYVTLTPPRLPAGETTATGPVVIIDRFINAVVLTTAPDSFSVEKMTTYVTAVTPTWAFATLAEPVTLEISVRNVGEVTAVFASGVPCTDVTQPNAMTVRCSLNTCENNSCVGPRPEGLVVEHIPAAKEGEDPDAPRALERITFFWQYAANPVMESDDIGPIFPAREYPHNIAHRVTLRFANNSLDASVPMKMFVGDESVCSCAIVHPWAIHFLLDPTKRQGNLPFSIMLTNGRTRAYNIPGGITFSHPITAPTISLVNPRVLVFGTGASAESSVSIFGYGMAPVEMTSQERACAASGTGYDVRAFPKVAGYQLTRVHGIDRNGREYISTRRFVQSSDAFGTVPPLGPNGTLVSLPDCTASPIRCLPGRYRIEAVGVDDVVVSDPPFEGQADWVEVPEPIFGAGAVAVRVVVAAAADSYEAAEDVRRKLWEVIDAATAASPAAAMMYQDRVLVYEPVPARGGELDGEKKGAVLEVIFTPVLSARASLNHLGDTPRPTPLFIAQSFTRDFLGKDGPVAEKIGRVIVSSSHKRFLCSDFSFSKSCGGPSSLLRYLLFMIIVGVTLVAAIAFGAYRAAKKNKRRTPALDAASINDYATLKE